MANGNFDHPHISEHFPSESEGGCHMISGCMGASYTNGGAGAFEHIGMGTV